MVIVAYSGIACSILEPPNQDAIFPSQNSPTSASDLKRSLATGEILETFQGNHIPVIANKEQSPIYQLSRSCLPAV
jgi:hypothetical protein